jgi:non-ribosomal peptide synthetase component F
MEAAEDIVKAALAADVVLHLVDGKLGYLAEHGEIPPTLRQRILASKDAILAFLKRAAPAQIVPVDRSVALPLSFGQQSLWLIDQLEGGSRPYHVSNVLELTGELDKGALQGSFDVIVQRHEVLRTTYNQGTDGPVQVVHEARPVSIDEIDLSMLVPEERAAQLDRIIQQAADRTFDLSRDSMLRLTLVRIGSAQHALITSMHHIVSDGWSLGIMMKELTAIYSALRRGQAHPLPPLAIQYGDFACWQRRTFTHEHLAGQLQYWRERLHGAPSTHGLPTDRPRQARQKFAGRSHGLRIDDPHFLRLLTDLSARTGATLFMILLSTYAVLLARWSNRKTIVIGTPIAGRTFEQLEPLLGVFLNSLVLELDVCLDSTFEELLGQARRHALDAYANQDIPFEMLVGELQPRRSLAHSPLFQMMFTLQNTEPVSFALPDLKIELLAPKQSDVKFDIQFVAGSDDRSLWLTWDYAQALFDPQTVRNLGNSFEVLLRGMVQTPAVPMFRLPLLARDDLATLERPQVSAAAVEKAGRLLDRFAAQVRATPHALALCAGTIRWSYAALNEQATSLANSIATAGIGPGTVVLVLLENAPIRFAALLALLECGAACITVEPSMVEERVADLIECGSVSFVLTETAHAVSLADLPGRVRFLDVLNMDTEPAKARHLPHFTPGADAVALLVAEQQQPATQRFVVLTHESIADYIDRRQRDVHMDSSSRMLLLPGACHFAPLEWMLPLVSGAQLHVMPATDCPSLHRVDTHMREERITHLTLPAALLPHLPLSTEHALQHLVLTGCTVPESTAWRWARTCRVSSIFGVPALPATCVAVIEPDRPVVYVSSAGIKIRILDPYSNRLPLGAVGEVHVCRVEHAAPSPQAGAKSHATGVLGRQDSHGAVEVLGLVGDDCGYDDFGVPLVTVEKYLSRYAAVANVVLSYRKSDIGRSLVAYTILAAASSAPQSALQEMTTLLKASLPDYMIPDEWICVDEFPVTLQGQIDRLAVVQEQPRRRWHDVEAEIPKLRTDRPWKTMATDRTDQFDCEYGRSAHAAASVIATALNVTAREALLGVYALLIMMHNSSNAACVAAGNFEQRPRGYLMGRGLAHRSFTLACRMDSHVAVASLIQKVADAIRAVPVGAVCAGTDRDRVETHLTDHPAQTQVVYLNAATGQILQGVDRLH